MSYHIFPIKTAYKETSNAPFVEKVVIPRQKSAPALPSLRHKYYSARPYLDVIKTAKQRNTATKASLGKMFKTRTVKKQPRLVAVKARKM